MSQSTKRVYKYYDLVMAAFVTVLICSNLIGAAKAATIHFPWFNDFRFEFGAGVLFFPISYIFGDILTEVYGYARARRVVWAGFAAIIFMSFMSWVVLALPSADWWAAQDAGAYQKVFGATPRIVLASIIAFFCGELANSYTLAKMKIASEGKHLWKRTIGSTFVGEFVDSMIFYPIAFIGLWESDQLVRILLTNYALKVGWEVLMTPVTYKIVNFLKKAEHEDYYDRNTDFTPFSIQT